MLRLLKLLSRHLLRPLLGWPAPIGVQRMAANLTGLLLTRPTGIRTKNGARAGLRERIAWPAGRESGAGGILYLHGGAYVLGGPRSHGPLTEWLAHHCRTTVRLPEYRLAPEHPCPAAIDDAVASWRDLAAAGTDTDRRLLAGDSAGGGLALATALALRDAGDRLPDGLVLLSPWVDLGLGSDSVRSQRARDVLLHPDWLADAARRYRGSLDAADPRCSPLFADLSGLPPVLIQAGTDELLADDARRLAERLDRAGVEVELRLYAGAGHVFQLYAGRDPAADRALDEIARFAARQRVVPA